MVQLKLLICHLKSSCLTSSYYALESQNQHFYIFKLYNYSLLIFSGYTNIFIQQKYFCIKSEHAMLFNNFSEPSI